MLITKSEILDLFINNIDQFVFWKDINSVYQGCNKNFANYAGYNKPDEVIGKTDYDMPWSKEEADFFIEIDQEVMKSGNSKLNFEEPQTRSDGETRWISTSKVPLFDNKKKVIGILGWYIDITPYKLMKVQIDKKNKVLLEYSQRLEKSKSALEQVNSDLEIFTNTVSHDLKSPINTIIGFSNLIINSHHEQLDEEVIEMLNYVLNAGQKMNHLVKSILTYARSGIKQESAERVKIKSFVAEKIKDIDQIVLNKEANIIIDFPDVEISCYPELLGIIFYNLIGNGIKYNESASPTVRCRMENEHSKIIFSISDNGIGIKSEFKEIIFQPFKRLHSLKIDGSGLGLSICKRIVELHGGRIWLDDDSTKGTNIKFSISKNLS